MKQIKRLIEKNDKIIILRHKDPDWDAFGSQFGLYHSLKARFPKKTILAVGDDNSLNCFQPLDSVTKEDYKDALVIILDTVAKQMLLGTDYLEAKKLVLIDHHLNDPDIRYDECIKDEKASSTAEIVYELLWELDFPITPEVARALLIGIVSDTGRFLYANTTPRTFADAGELVEFGANLQSIYEMMYTEPLNMKRVKAAFSNSVSYTAHNVAYRKNDADFMKEHGVDVHTVSRGLVGQMAGAKEVAVWANFTFDERIGKILCELRSRSVPIVDVARKYGGGGHAQACGCTVDTWEDADKILDELDKIAEAIHG